MQNKPKQKKKRIDWREQDVWNRRKAFWPVVCDFRKMGFEVKNVDKYTYCFAESIVIDPGARTYKILKTGEQGETKGKNLNIFIREFFGLRSSI